jgi:predicted amidohydrolase YtcJ
VKIRTTPKQPHELALVDANVLTQDPEMPTADAVLSIGGIIHEVGTTEEISEAASPDAEVLPVDGKTVLPGFIDSHQHPLGYGLAKAGHWIDCSDVKSINDLVALAEAKAEELPPGEWIFGRGWPIWQLERLPRKEDFAGRVEDHPVWFNDLSGHFWIVNELGLDTIDVDAKTPEPEVGKIDRKDGGEPTGIFRDNAPFGYIDAPSPFDAEDLKDGLRTTMRKVNQMGITTIGQIGIWIPPGGYGTERIKPWLEMEQSGELDVRVQLMLEPYEQIWEVGDYKYLESLSELGVITGFGSDMVELGPLKIICDGWQDSKTGYMKEPYANDESRTGYLYRSDPEDYYRMIRDATEAGLQIGIHADGDASAELAIDAFERVAEEFPDQFDSLRHRFEHARVLTDDQVERIVDLGIVVCAAPVNYSRESWYFEGLKENMGPEREHELLRHKTLADKGVVVSGGSDLHPGRDRWMEPLSAIDFLVNAGPENERFTVEEAIRLYTINGAYSFRNEEKLGSITPGKLTDFVVLSDDPTNVPTDEIRDISVERTIVAGETVVD